MSKIERFLNYDNSRSKDLIRATFNEALTEALVLEDATSLQKITNKLIELLGLRKDTTNGKNKSTAPGENKPDKSNGSNIQGTKRTRTKQNH